MDTQKKWSLLLYMTASIFFMEMIIRIATVNAGFFSADILRSLLFSVSLAALLYLACTFMKPRGNRNLAAVFLALTAVVFSSQLIYHEIFTTFYTIYSASRAIQVIEFWKEILSVLAANFRPIILLFLPFILLLSAGRKFLSFTKTGWLARAILVGVIIVTQVGGIAAIHAGGRDQTSAYSLYYQRSFPVQSVQRLGLITTMRLDMQRLISGWTPSIELPPLDDVQAWVPEDPPAEDEPVKYNALDIDFEALIAAEKNETIEYMHWYFRGLQPSRQNEYTGKYQGYNLILITAEGFSHLAVREDVTPTLYRMVQEGYKFTDFYTPLWGVSTSDGEYVACTGLIPKSGVWSFKRSAGNSLPLVMGNQLNRLGYQTVAYHNHTHTYYGRNISHPNMGYVYKGIGSGLEMRKQWPRSDLEMMEKTIPEYIGQHQFHAYYMTVSGHLNYTFGGNNMASKNRNAVKDLPYSEGPRAYLATQIELDKAIEHLISQLEEAGVADKTLIAISADHYPYGLKNHEIEELSGEKIEDNFDLYRNAFILWTKGMEPITIDEPCSSLDIIPTISNLLGLEYDSRLLMGRDIHSDTEPLVIFADGSFITKEGKYDAKTGDFTPNPGAQIYPGYAGGISTQVARKTYFSALILDKDYYSIVLPNR